MPMSFQDRDPQDEPAAIRIFRSYVDRCRRTGELAERAAFDPIDIPRLLPHIFLVDPVEGGHDFRYRLIGDHIRERSPENFTGRLLSEIADIGSQSQLIDLYHQAIAQRAIVGTRIPYRTPGLQADSYYDVVVAPFADKNEEIVQLIGVAIYAA